MYKWRAEEILYYGYIVNAVHKFVFKFNEINQNSELGGFWAYFNVAWKQGIFACFNDRVIDTHIQHILEI